MSDAEGYLEKRTLLLGGLISRDIEQGHLESRWPFEGLNNLSQARGFLFWLVVRPDGTIHLADNAAVMGARAVDFFSEVSAPPDDPKVLFYPRKNCILYQAPLNLGRETWSFWLGFSLDEITEIKKTIFFQGFLMTVGTMGILGILLFFIIRHYLQPIRGLSAGVSAIGGGDLWHRVPVSSQDELGELAEGFNRMAQALQEKTQALSEREQFLANIFASIQDGISILDCDYTIIQVNPAMERAYPQSPPLVGKKCYQAYRGRSQPCEICPTRRTLETQKAAREMVIERSPTGEICRYIDLYTFPMLDQASGKIKGVVEYIYDITAKKQAELEVTKSQEEHRLQLQAVFDGIPEPLLMVDREMRFKLLNRAALRYYQADSPESVVGKPCYQLLKGLAAPCAGCKLAAAVSQGEFLLCERQGARDPARQEEVFVYPLPEAFGREGAAIIRISDITEARLIERHLLQSEKLASLGLLVAGIAHEINNPNSFITFNIPILRSYLQELLPVVDRHAQAHPDFAVCRMPYGEFRQDLFKLVDNLEHGSSRINTTVSALRDFARERGKGEITEFDLQKMIDQVVSICQGRIRKTAKTFTVEVPAGLPPMSGDPLALGQILINLLTNATQALDKEDSRVTLKVALGEAGEEGFIF